MYVVCEEKEATHVRILEEEDKIYNLTKGQVYEILSDEEDAEMIRANNGDLMCDFSIYISVEWLKKDE